MKKTQWIELFQNVKRTFVTYLAIVIFVSLAAGLYTCMSWTVTSLHASVDEEYKNGLMHDYEISYPYGFDEEFLSELKTLQFISDAEGYYETYRFGEINGQNLHFHISSLTSEIDVPERISGRLPEAENEIAVTSAFAKDNGVKPGDEITFKESVSNLYALHELIAEDFTKLTEEVDELNADSFTVTAIVDNASYLAVFPSMNGVSPIIPAPVDAVLFVNESAFNKLAFCGYSKILIKCNDLNKYGSFTTDYEENSNVYKAIIQEKLTSLTQTKYDVITESEERMRTAINFLAGISQAPEIIEISENFERAAENIKPYEAGVASRIVNGAFGGVKYLAQSFEKMKYTLVVPFLLISLLVCYSAVSRLIFEQKKLIGTKKALGFSTFMIILPYLLYSFTAAAIGGTLGLLMSRFGFVPILVSNINNSYLFGKSVIVVSITSGLLFVLIEIAVTLLSAFIASFRVSRQKAQALLTGESTKSIVLHGFIDKLMLFKRLPLLTKTIIKNCISEPKRVFATLIGIVGCITLVVGAVSTNDNLAGSLDYNFKNVTKFNSVVYFDGSESAKTEISNVFSESGLTYSTAKLTLGDVIIANGDEVYTQIYVVDDPEFYQLFNACTKAGEKLTSTSGALVNIACSEHSNIGVGDSVRFVDGEGQTRIVPVEGVFDFYLMYYSIIMSESCYNAYCNSNSAPNVFIVNIPEGVKDKVLSSLKGVEGYVHYLDFYQNAKFSYDSVTGIMFAVMIIYLAISVILAVFLLLNMFTMLVRERKRELIILMINGYSKKSVKKYVYTDTLILTVIGIIIGLVCGVILGDFSLTSFNNSATHFLNGIDIKACIFGLCFTLGLTLLLCKIAVGKINEFSLADIDTI